MGRGPRPPRPPVGPGARPAGGAAAFPKPQGRVRGAGPLCAQQTRGAPRLHAHRGACLSVPHTHAQPRPHWPLTHPYCPQLLRRPQASAHPCPQPSSHWQPDLAPPRPGPPLPWLPDSLLRALRVWGSGRCSLLPAHSAPAWSSHLLGGFAGRASPGLWQGLRWTLSPRALSTAPQRTHRAGGAEPRTVGAAAVTVEAPRLASCPP